MGDPFWRNGFGPLLPDTESVPFDDLAALEQKLSSRQVAAYIVEPLQAEAGIRVPGSTYLKMAQDLCRRYGTLFVADEVQTGMYRTGPFLASHHFGIEPDMIVLAKALSGGLVPVAATLITDSIYQSVYNSLKRSIVHTSTFAENALSMRAGLASLAVLESEGLGQRATVMGDYLRQSLRAAIGHYEMVNDIRGLGLLNGIQF